MMDLAQLDRRILEEWLLDAAKNWLAHDGLWFQAVEKCCGLQQAIELDIQAWQQFTVIEAKRIMGRLGIPKHSGIAGLATALDHRLYALLNKQIITEQTETRCVFTMLECRVQIARKRQGLPDFPCKEVGIVEYTHFARTIDPRLHTRCISCPPDAHSENSWCSWEFTIDP